MSFVRNSFLHTISYVKSLPKKYSIGSALGFVFLAFVGWHFLSQAVIPPTDTATTTQVSIASVGSLSGAAGPLPVTGKVASLSQATVLAQTSGEVVVLNRALGDYVQAGAVIASFENSSQRASVLQAQGALDAAAAALARSTGSTADNSQTTSLVSLQSAYAALDDAVHVRADQLFTNAKTSSAELVIVVPNSALVATIRNERIALEETLAAARTLSSETSATDVTGNSVAMLAHVQETRLFLDNLIQAVNEATQSQNGLATTLAGYQASLAIARSEVLSAQSSIMGAKTGNDSNDLAGVRAAVKQAQGALAGAQSLLEKTVVRSPIAGTIVSLPVTQGSYVPAFTTMAIVSNPGALYVDTHVTPDDAKTLVTGDSALIDGSIQGVITFIAPAIDPLTGKIEVKIGIRGDYRSLTDGSIVNVALHRTSAPLKPSTEVTIPIVAVKMTPNGPVVFSVDATSALLAHTITLGSILGDRIMIKNGLTIDNVIVTDARGLSEGQVVTVK